MKKKLLEKWHNYTFEKIFVQRGILEVSATVANPGNTCVKLVYKDVCQDGIFSLFVSDSEHHCTIEKVTKMTEDTRISVIQKGQTNYYLYIYSLR